MSFNQRAGHGASSNPTSNRNTSGAQTSNVRQPVSHASNVNSNPYEPSHSHWRQTFTKIESSILNQGSIPVAHGSAFWGPSIQNSNTHAPTTRQPPTLPGIAATSAIQYHPGQPILVPSNSRNNQDASAPYSWVQVYIDGETWVSRGAVVPHNGPEISSTPVVDNPHSPWNRTSSPAPLNPHRVVASVAPHPASAGYHASTFTYGPVSARNRELIDGSAPLGLSNVQFRGPNPLGAVGESGPAYTRYVVSKFGEFTAKRQARMSNAQSQVEVEPGMNEASDSVGMDTPSSDDEDDLYDASVNGDGSGEKDEGEEQDDGGDEEVLASEEGRSNGLNAED